MSNYLRKTNIIKKKPELQDYSLSNNNIDDEYAEILKGMSIDKITELINKYPDYKYHKLIESIKKEFKIKNVVLGCGSEDLIIRTNLLLRSKGEIGIFLPNFYRTLETAGNYKKIYSYYKTESNIIDLENISISKDIKSIWISNPNPMNGKMYNKEQLSELIKKYSEIIFIIDESTIDFIKDSNKYSLMGLAQKIDNIIIIRSFSKLYGTAGLRVGFATGKAKILKEIEKVGLTFPVNGIAEYFINSIIKKKKIINNIRKRINKHKILLEKLLSNNKDIIISKSVTNCIFFKHKKVNIFNELLNMNILALSLNDQDEIINKGFVRLTVHSSEILFSNLYNRITKLLKNI